MDQDSTLPRRSAQATGWPTTMTFSRRMGEAGRDADYATAFEGPQEREPVHLEFRVHRRPWWAWVVAALVARGCKRG